MVPDETTDPQPEKPGPSFGNMSEHHWSRARKDQNQEALEHYRGRSKAPGVESGGSHRNQYCPQCHGVVALEYDSRVAVDRTKQQRCPHCGAEFVPGVVEMFNWVEMDQVPASDARALLPILGALALVIALLAFFLLRGCLA